MIRAASTFAFAVLAAAPAAAQDWDCSKADELPQMGMNWCAGQDYQAADKALNNLWPKIRASMKDDDAELKKIDPSLVGAEAALMKAQRAWIDYRDGQCEGEGFYARGGSLEGLLIATCKTRMTRERTEELRKLIEVN